MLIMREKDEELRSERIYVDFSAKVIMSDSHPPPVKTARYVPLTSTVVISHIACDFKLEGGNWN